MTESREKPLLGKVVIAGGMRCETGLHIGAQGSGGEIGGLDKPVVRDPITRQPYVPGSSMKGKLRALLERSLEKPANHKGAPDIYRHECADTACAVCRLMGSSGRQEGVGRLLPIPARLTVRDLWLTAESVKELEGIDTGLLYTEWKFENSLDRVTAAANPRQMERIPAGAEFRFEMIYNVETPNPAQVREDLVHLARTLELLEDDALGGSGSRGYGKVSFRFATFEGRRPGYYAGQREERITRDVADRDWPSHCEAIARFFAQ